MDTAAALGAVVLIVFFPPKAKPTAGLIASFACCIFPIVKGFVAPCGGVALTALWLDAVALAGVATGAVDCGPAVCCARN